jgi:hypothetical protein
LRCVGGRSACSIERFLVGPLFAWLRQLCTRTLKRLAETECAALSPAALFELLLVDLEEIFRLLDYHENGGVTRQRAMPQSVAHGADDRRAADTPAP